MPLWCCLLNATQIYRRQMYIIKFLTKEKISRKSIENIKKLIKYEESYIHTATLRIQTLQ